MYLGELMEFGQTDQIFVKPSRKETEDYITGRSADRAWGRTTNNAASTACAHRERDEVPGRRIAAQHAQFDDVGFKLLSSARRAALAAHDADVIALDRDGQPADEQHEHTSGARGRGPGGRSSGMCHGIPDECRYGLCVLAGIQSRYASNMGVNQRSARRVGVESRPFRAAGARYLV